MSGEMQAGRSSPTEVLFEGVPQALSDWADLGASTKLHATRSMRPGCAYLERLKRLLARGRFLNVRIENARLGGLPSADLEQELETRLMETRSFLIYLEWHARVLP
jgi:hypothetical protein